MPANPDAGFEESLSRARALHHQGNAAQAADDYRRALDRRPDHVATRLALGRALLECREAAEARKELFVALQHDPDQMVARRLLVDANLALENDLEAHRWLVEYLGVMPEDDEARRLLAEIEPRLRTTPPKATRTLFEGLIEDAPANPELRALAEQALRAEFDHRGRAERLLRRLRAWQRALNAMTV